MDEVGVTNTKPGVKANPQEWNFVILIKSPRSTQSLFLSFMKGYSTNQSPRKLKQNIE